MRLAVIVSGSGTILRAMLDEGLPVSVVLSDRPCNALALAEQHGIAAELVDRAARWRLRLGVRPECPSRSSVAATLVAHQVDLVAMAGFGTVHDGRRPPAPSRSDPEHAPGAAAGVPRLARGAGRPGRGRRPRRAAPCTWPCSRSTPARSSPRRSVRVLPGDTEESLHERIKEVERRLYPATIRRVLRGPRRRTGTRGTIRRVLDQLAGEAGTKGAFMKGDWPREGAALRQRQDRPGSVPAKGLEELGWELVASGNTARAPWPRRASPTSASPT